MTNQEHTAPDKNKIKILWTAGLALCLMEIAFIGMMGAIVFVSNYISFTIPLAIGGDITRVHVANAFCLLAGLSLGPVAGGLSAGIGSMLYDLTIPQFIAGSPFTFAFKCVIAGGGKKSGSSSAKIIAGGVAGQVCYIVLYIGKKFITYYFLHKEPLNVTIAACATSLLTSLTNAVIAVVIACLLVIVQQCSTNALLVAPVILNAAIIVPIYAQYAQKGGKEDAALESPLQGRLA